MTQYAIVAVDPKKTALAAVVVTPDGYEVRTRTMPKQLELCTHKAMRWMCAIVREVKRNHPMLDVWVFIEKPVLGRGGAMSTIVQAQVQGAIQAGAIEGGAFQVREVNNSSWKKSIVGVGNASKTDIQKRVRRVWPALYRDALNLGLRRIGEDVCDSGCIYLHGDKIAKQYYRPLLRGKGRFDAR